MQVHASEPLRILDFDSECRPMHYSEWRAESQVTGLAWSWVGEDKVHCEVLNQNLANEEKMWVRFMKAFNEADIVTGHYIRKHDLPLIAEHCARLEMPIPRNVLTSDTKMDFIRVRGLGASQENLSLTFGLDADKHHMAGADWRVANMITEPGKEGTRVRVTSDVIQHKQLREDLVNRGLLKPPSIWNP